MIISMTGINLVPTTSWKEQSNRSVWKTFIAAARVCREKGNIHGGIQLYKRGLREAWQEGLDAEAPELIGFLETNLWK